MIDSRSRADVVEALGAALTRMPLTQSAAARFEELVTSGLDRLPRPGQGDTLLRWRALATVAGYDISLVKLYEGHTDALAILAELEGVVDRNAHDTSGVWAAEPPGVRVMIEPLDEGAVRLRGRKPWCSGAAHVSHGLLTAWHAPTGRARNSCE